MKVSARSADPLSSPGRPLLASHSDSAAFEPAVSLDIQCCILLGLLTALMLLPASLTLPMEVWDESRNANNAMAIANHGGWMVPAFGGEPDHWNTKPPLLIWIIAALLRAGMDPLLAVRLPSVAATAASVLLVYSACRVIVRDRLAGVLGGALVLCSELFMGDHVGRTGDYDAMLSFLSLGFILCAGRYIDGPRDHAGAWLGAGGVLLFLAFMTKGVAAGMAGPGVLAYALARREFLSMARDRRLWITGFGVIAGVSAWLARREQLDPGYLQAMWHNDVAGRMMLTLDDHGEGPLFYPMVLIRSCQPAMLLAPALFWLFRRGDAARRDLCLLMVLSTISWVAVLSCAATKLDWYIAPAVPPLAIAVAISTTACLRAFMTRPAGQVVIPFAGVALLMTFWSLNVRAPEADSAYGADQVGYGAFFDEVRGGPSLDGAVIVDLGLPNNAGFQYYNPVARFYADDAARRGEQIQIAAPGETIAGNATIISCDPKIRERLHARGAFTVLRRNPRCVLGRVSNPINP